MKPLLLASMALAALPLLAGETQKETQSTPAPAVTTTSAPAAPADSPLVAAAKASQAKKRKAKIVITNDNLIKTGGHITTANTAPAALPPVPPHRSEEEMRAEQAQRAANAKIAADRAAAEQKTKEQRRANSNTVLDAAEGAAVFDDPAMAEHIGEQVQKAKAADEKKPPK